MLNTFFHWRWIVCLAILCAFLAELMNPTSSFVRAEPTPMKKVVKVEIAGKVLTYQTTRREPEAPLSDEHDGDEDDGDDTILVHSHAWVDLGSLDEPRRASIVKEIYFPVRDLMSDGVRIPEVDPPSFA